MKIYVIGAAKGYANWMEEAQVNSVEEADLVWLTGGEDINPKIYGQNKGSRTHFNSGRDDYEIEELNKAITQQKPLFGTCRGAQMLCAFAGGQLVQHMAHPSHHAIRFWDGSYADTTSCHHQLQLPFSIKNKDEYEVLAWAEGLSNVYLNGDDSNIILPTDDNNIVREPELVYYRTLKALGIQGHPEWMGRNTKLVKILKKLTNMLVNDELDIAVRLGLPLERIMDSNFRLDESDYILYTNVMSGIKKDQEKLILN